MSIIHYAKHLVSEIARQDKSFLPERKSPFQLMFGSKSDWYKREQVREIYLRAIEFGIETGLTKASLEGQRLELFSNSPQHTEVLEELYRFLSERNIAIQFHPHLGMVVVETKNTPK